MSLSELIEKGLELPPADQYELAARMLARAEASTVDQAVIDAASKTELRGRIEDIESGRMQLVDHAETVQTARARVAERRAKRAA